MSDDQFTKLTKYMDKQFEAVDERFKSMDERFEDLAARLDTKADNELVLKLYQHMEERFAKVDARLDASHAELKADINRIYELLDKDLKQRETDEQERLAMGHQLTRHETWIRQLARQGKAKLVPEP